MVIDITGKVVMIADGADGAGRIFAKEFAGSGADIAAGYLPGQEEAAGKTAEEVEALGRKCLLLELDMEKAAKMAPAVRKIEETFGRLDGLILNESPVTRVAFADMTASDWDTSDAVMGKSAAFLCREAAGLMMKHQYGRIVSVGDLSYYKNESDLVAYASSRCSQAKLMMGLAVYYAPYIKCNALNISDFYGGDLPYGGIVEGKDSSWQTNDVYGVAELLQFLVGCKNSCGLSGAIIPVDNAAGLMSYRN